MYDPMLEREGKWTTVALEADRVIIRYTRTYVRGAYAKSIFVSMLIGWFLFPEFFRRFERTYAIFATSVVVVILGKFSFQWIRRSVAMVRRPYVIILDRSTARHEVDSEVCIHAVDIKAVEVRENSGRNSDDSALWQTYVHLKNSESVLIHQRYKWKHEAEVELARGLADRWKVPLRAG